MSIAVSGNDIAGLSLALRLRIKGHDVVVHDAPQNVVIAEQFTVIAPFRDLFLKSGGALDDQIGLREVSAPLHVKCGNVTVALPAAGTQVPAVAAALGIDAGRQWSRLLSDAADTWQAVRTGTFTPRTSLHTYLRQHIADQRLRAIVQALAPYPNARHLSDAAIIAPYLRQTFGVWEFDGGLNAFEMVLRERCASLGIAFASQSAPMNARCVDDYFRPMFAAPRRLIRQPSLTPPVTQRLGLPFIGMAAEAIANQIGRATSQ